MTPKAQRSTVNPSPRTRRLQQLLAFDRCFLDPAGIGETASEQILLFPFTRHGDVLKPPVGELVGFDEAGRGALAGPVTVACVRFDWRKLCSPRGDIDPAVLETYEHLNDSKQVSARRRVNLARQIRSDAQFGIGCAAAVEIDRLGIVNACKLAAQRALRRLDDRTGTVGGPRGTQSQCPNGNSSVRIGLFDRGLGLEDESVAFSSSVQVTKGDAKSFHIAAASILAKVWRDTFMETLAMRDANERAADPHASAETCEHAEVSGFAEVRGFAEPYGFAEPCGFAEPYGFARHKGYGSAAHIAAIRHHGTSRFHRQTFLKRIQG